MTNENRLLLTMVVVSFVASALTSCYLHAEESNSFGVMCSKDGKYSIVENTEVAGPGFTCELGEPVFGVGTGLAAWQAKCEGHKSGLVVLDNGNYTDHAELQLPGSKKWIKLYNKCPHEG